MYAYFSISGVVDRHTEENLAKSNCVYNKNHILPEFDATDYMLQLKYPLQFMSWI